MKDSQVDKIIRDYEDSKISKDELIEIYNKNNEEIVDIIFKHLSDAIKELLKV